VLQVVTHDNHSDRTLDLCAANEEERLAWQASMAANGTGFE
jgi:hypothetical protein